MNNRKSVVKVLSTQFDLPGILEAYNRDNYKIITGTNDSSDVYIFFSSNGLYFPNTEKALRDAVFINDRYEWEYSFANLQIPFRKAIFVRDVQKTWYCEGISVKHPTIKAVVSLLKEIIPDNCDITCVGNSAGGYAAILFGHLLCAKRIFNISGGIDISVRATDKENNPKLWAASFDSSKSEYFNLSPIVAESGINVYYFYPARSPNDALYAEQANCFKNVHAIPIKSQKHGSGPFRFLYRELFFKSNEELISLFDSVGRTARSNIDIAFKIISVKSGIKVILLYSLSILKFICKKRG